MGGDCFNPLTRRIVLCRLRMAKFFIYLPSRDGTLTVKAKVLRYRRQSEGRLSVKLRREGLPPEWHILGVDEYKSRLVREEQ